MNTSINLVNYYERIKNYKKICNKFKKLKEKQCLTFGKKNKYDDYYEYFLNNKKIILKKRIGSESRYGLIFLTSTNYNKNIIFATKIMIVDSHNYTEIILSKKLSNITLKDINPHFLLVYKALICNNITSNKKLPELVRYDDYYITINELADDNLKNFLININDPELIKNAYQQIMLAILSFHYHTGGVYHRDCHYKNFLYHKIEKGGYFHYNLFGKNIYIENKGYIWLIWDFGIAKTEENRKLERLKDYLKVNQHFKSSHNYTDSNKFIEIKDFVSNMKSLYKKYRDIIGNSDLLFFKNILNDLFESSYNKKSFIINKKPYCIKNF